jgi:hypothetical protein
MKNFKIYAIIAVVSLLIGRYVLQPKPVTVIQWKEKIIKVEETKKKTVKRTIKKPDGSVIEDSTETEDTNSTTDTARSGSKKSGSGITLGLLAVKDWTNFQKTNAEAVVIVPFYGNLKIIGSVDTTKQIGIGLGLEF